MMKQGKRIVIVCMLIVALSSICVLASSTSNNWYWPTTNHVTNSSWPNYSDGSYHGGFDFSVPVGTPVYSTCDGTVMSVQYLTSSYGYHIKVKATINNQTHYLRYCHLSRIDVKEGYKVRAGEQIGLSGNTGNSSGPHLHYEIRNSTDGYKTGNVIPTNFLPGTSYYYTTWNSIDIKSDIPSLYVGEANTFIWNVSGTISKSDVKWTSSNPSILAVDNIGNVKGLKAGEAMVTAYVTNPDGSIDCQSSKNITIKDPTINITTTTRSFDFGKSLQLKAVVVGPSKNITWTSSNPLVVVSSNGLLTTNSSIYTGKKSDTQVRSGESIITATANGVSAAITITVNDVKSAALAAYKSFLAGNNNYFYCQGKYVRMKASKFLILDINKDGSPELILGSKSDKCAHKIKRFKNHHHINVWTYKNGAVVHLNGYLTKSSYVNNIWYSSSLSTIYIRTYTGKYGPMNAYGYSSSPSYKNKSSAWKKCKLVSNTKSNRKKYCK